MEQLFVKEGNDLLNAFMKTNDIKFQKDWNSTIDACRKFDSYFIYHNKQSNFDLNKWMSLIKELHEIVGMYEIDFVFTHLVRCARWINAVELEDELN